MPPLRRLAATIVLALLPLGAAAETARIAVAANFAPTAEKLAEDYAGISGNRIEVISGATGKIYAQIREGAPFAAMLSADQATIEKLVDEGFADGATRFTYARGRLALWSARDGADLADPKAALRAATHVAIANPDLAPYGKAAMETIEKLGLTVDLEGKIVTGESIAQAQTMVASKAADIGFVAASAVIGRGEGSVWLVPEDMHGPLLQDAALLKAGKDNAAARGFLDYLRSAPARKTIGAAGYATE